MTPCFYFFKGSFAYIGKSTDTSFHSHHALQIAVSLNKPFELETENSTGEYNAIVIDTNVNHRFDSKNDWHLIVLVDPEHAMVRKLKCCDRINSIFEPPLDDLKPKVNQIVELMKSDAHCTLVKNAIFNILSHLAGEHHDPKDTDPRIIRIFEYIDSLEEKKVSVETLMGLVNLSESRLSHLFKESTGVPIRRYLLWTRLIETFDSVMAGFSLTEAAHNAGFSDSAHLSRTFKSMFGATPSTYIKKSENSQFIQFKNC
jgi:AraC-like DNA-binding protein